MVNHIISNYSKLAPKKYKIRLHWGESLSTENYARDWNLVICIKKRIHPRKWDTQIFLGFWDPNKSPNPSQKTRLCQEEKCHQVDFTISADHRVKMKQREKIDKYMDLTRELKKLCNMRMTVIPILIGALGIILKGLEKRLEEFEIRGRTETI